jgi:predicted Rossmann fold flavoprotein
MVRTQSGGYSAGAIVIATGGRSYPSTGSTGDGYRFAASLSHAVVPARPALTPLLIRGYPFPSLSGISFASIPFSIWRRGKKIAEHTGDVLLTHKGISGPGILDASREILAGDEVRLSFAGSTSQEAVSADLAAAHDAGTELVRAILLRYQIPDRLTRALLKHAGIAEDMRCAHLTASQRRSVASLATAFPLIVESPGDFSIAMATAGGVALCEINRKTMESKKVPSLYFAGEVIDIDGDTGGYNIQAALSTGALAAHSIAKRWGQDPC